LANGILALEELTGSAVRGLFIYSLAVRLNVNVMCLQQQAADSTELPTFIAEVLLHLTKDSARSGRISAVKPCPPKDRGEMQV